MNFIDKYFLSDLSICDDLITLFKNSKNKCEGISGIGIDKTIKDSTDVTLWDKDIPQSKALIKYFEELYKFTNLYKNKYTSCNNQVDSWGLESVFKIQKYKPSQAYHSWHCEKGNVATAIRHLVWMTYLNDVKKGGETEWYYQKLKIKPKKGLTVIWPSEWTFTHKGHTTINEDKYIITGWYEFKK
mgnify:CR=1 FL=1